MFRQKFTISVVLLVLTLLAHKLVLGQQQRLLSMNNKTETLDQLIGEIENISGYRFYYDSIDVKGLQVQIKEGNYTVEQIVAKVLSPTSLHFAIDPLHHIYITRNTIIQQQLPEDYFNHFRKDPAPMVQVTPEQQGRERKSGRSMADNRIFEIGAGSAATGKATIAGYVRDEKNGEPVSGASVYVDSSNVGTVTDQFGYFSLTVTRGRHTLSISSAGMKTTHRQILLHGDGKLDIGMVDYIPSLREVVVTAERRSNIRSVQMGVERLSSKTIKMVPVVFGEADVLKVVLTLPGVTSTGEASGGFNVRGGASDQNLILLNDATIYNPTHLFGFFSAFNPDIIKSVDLYKSNIPEKYGGRLSSVLDVTTREGNSKKLAGTGGIGLLTSKLTLEGPIVKDKTTFILSGRTTYSNWLLHALPDKTYQNSSAAFSDMNVHLNHTFNSKNSLFLNGYWSNDQFRLNRDTLFKYGNRNMNVKWKHLFNNKSSSVFTTGTDHYQYEIASTANPVKAFDLRFAMDQTFFRADFSLSPNTKHHIDYGLNTVYYSLQPGSYQPSGPQSLVTPNRLPAEQGLESAVYAGDQFDISPNLSVNAGLRFSVFNYLGPHVQYGYVPGVPKDKSSIIDTTSYGSGKVIKTYAGPEIRAALRYSLSDQASVKVSFNSLRQYIHMLTNTFSISPTDVWKLSDAYIKPQLGQQLSVGYYRNINKNDIETSVEIYYKRLYNYLDYKSGAQLIMNQHIETDVINTEGKAYGAELLIKKQSGKLNGWISYTYSRTFLRSRDSLAGEVINQGRYYPSNFDKPHNVNLISNYRFSHRYSISFNLVYSTGRPITLPIAVFDAAGGQRVFYSDRNQYRIPDYFRTDFSFTMEGNHKVKQLAHNSWSFGVYNLTARKNPYSIYFKEENGVIRGYKLFIFGTAIPFITYNFRF